MGKNEDPDLQQREQNLESGNDQGRPGSCWMLFSRLSNDLSFKCVFVLFLSLSVLLPGIFWILPYRSITTGFDAKQAIKLSASVRAYFKLQKPVSELVRYVEKLEYDIYEEIGMPATKVVVLSMHQSGASNSTDVVFGLLSDPISSPINPVSLSVLRSSLIELFLQQSNLTLTTSIFGQPSKFEILKFPKGITVIPVQPAFIWPITQMLFNFTLNNSIAEILANFIQLKDQLKYGLRLRPYENLFVQLTNQKGSTISSLVIIQASVTSSDFGNLLPQRLKQLAQTITESPAKNLGLNNSVFGKVKSISLSSYLKGTLHATAPTASPAPSPEPSISPHPSFRPTHPPASSPKSHHPQPCRKCKAASPSGNSPLHSPGPESGPYPSFPPLISPAPSTIAPPPCPYSRPATPRSHSNLTPHHPHSTSQLSPDLPPLPSVSYGSHPGQGIDSVKGPVSAPLAQSPSVQSPSSKAVSVLPLDTADKSNFSAPLTRGCRRPHFQRFMRSVSGPMKRTFSKHSMGSGWMQRFLLHPLTRLAWHAKEPKLRSEPSRNCLEGGPSEGEYGSSRNLQWAHGKAGEDRVHVVLSEEQGWLFIGIYDGFSGPDAPDFLMSHLYKAIDKELEGLLWDYEDKSRFDPLKPEISTSRNPHASFECSKENQSNSCSDQEILSSIGELLNQENTKGQSSNNEIVEENDDVRDKKEQDLSKCRKSTLGAECECESFPHANLAGQGRKSMRLYELLQMEPWDGQGSLSISQMDRQGKSSCNFQPLSDNLECINPSNFKDDRSNIQGEDPTTSGEDIGVGLDFDNQGAATAATMSGQRHNTRKSLIGSKIRKVYRKQKSLRKKLFPWSYDWHREEICVDERIVESSGPIRRRKSGVVEHDAVLRAMARALESTEEAYMEMVEKALDINPELALMGSCVLVMLMKDQDVYVMNLGDSRVILAQERPNDRHPNPNSVKDDLKYRNRSRELLARMELDRISEESPMHNQHGQVSILNKNRDISICRLKMKALQLSTDHSTSIEEEILRIQAEHPDDDKAISNDRVKGQLKVTRAFGAGFLKKPACNEALLEMFQIDYVGNAPYVSCIPSVVHHRLSPSDRFLVLSSDGLYQYFSNEEVVAHVTWFMENVPEGDPAQYLVAELLFRAAKKNGMDFHELLDIPHGDRRKYHDDVSVMVVSLEGRIWRSSG